MLRVALVLCLIAVPGAAQSNGRFPDTIDVHFKPGDHDVFALQATWGLLTTFDAGETFRWSCEEAVGFGGIFDPDYAITPTGLILATTTAREGLRLTRDLCTWAGAPAPLAPPDPDDPQSYATFIAQVEVGPDGVIYAMASTIDDSQLYVSTDDGVSFAPRSAPGGLVTWWETLHAVPLGETTRLYLAGYDLGKSGAKTRRLFRSDDAGVEWTELPTTDFTFGGDLADLQIAAVSPTDPDLLFARVYQANGRGIGDDVYRSADAGATWTRVHQSGDNVTSVVVRQSGEVLLTTALSGHHASSDGGVTFGPAFSTDLPINCMKERDDGVLFACSKSFPPTGMALGRGPSIPELASIYTFAETCEPVRCADGTVQRDTCELARWPATVQQFGIDESICGSGGPDAAPPDAGDAEPPKKTCTDCSTGTPGSMLVFGALIALPLVRRRRR